MILIIKHIDIEGPGTIGDYLQKREITHKIIELSQGDPLPDDLSGIDAIIVLGGPMNVYEEDKYPWLKEENSFIQKVLEQGIPTLGICLGSQLVAKASGARVFKAPVKEIGWGAVELNESGEYDPMFNGVAKSVAVFQWHEDTFEIPKGAVLLASSKGCPHQAYRLGANAYGFQFHLEINEELIRNWVQRYFKINSADEHPDGQNMLQMYNDFRTDFNQQAETIYKNFITIIKDHAKSSASPN